MRQGKGTVQLTETNNEGIYNFPGLQPAIYNIEIRQPRFQTQTQTGIVLNVGDRLRLDFVLTLGESTQTITVSEDAAAIAFDSATLQNTIGREQINDLPLNGRNAAALVLLSPGTSDLTAGNSGGRGVPLSNRYLSGRASLYLQRRAC